MPGRRTKTSAVFVAALFIGVLGAHESCLANDLVEVQVSSDLKRVVVRAQDSIRDYSSFTLHRPSRLVIDIPGCGSGDVHRIDPPGKPGSLGVRVSGTRSGARLVLDFKGGQVPAHRIRRMDNCLLVFLSDWSVPATASSSRHLSVGEESPRPAQRNSRRSHSRERGFAERVKEHSSDISIKSAEVVNGIIVLQVAENRNPNRIYRIELGVNLDTLGFDSAGIRRSSMPVQATGGPGPVGPVANLSAADDNGEAPRVVTLPSGQWDIMDTANGELPRSVSDRGPQGRISRPKGAPSVQGAAEPGKPGDGGQIGKEESRHWRAER